MVTAAVGLVVAVIIAIAIAAGGGNGESSMFDFDVDDLAFGTTETPPAPTTSTPSTATSPSTTTSPTTTEGTSTTDFTIPTNDAGPSTTTDETSRTTTTSSSRPATDAPQRPPRHEALLADLLVQLEDLGGEWEIDEYYDDYESEFDDDHDPFAPRAELCHNEDGPVGSMPFDDVAGQYYRRSGSTSRSLFTVAGAVPDPAGARTWMDGVRTSVERCEGAPHTRDDGEYITTRTLYPGRGWPVLDSDVDDSIVTTTIFHLESTEGDFGHISVSTTLTAINGPYVLQTGLWTSHDTVEEAEAFVDAQRRESQPIFDLVLSRFAAMTS